MKPDYINEYLKKFDPSRFDLRNCTREEALAIASEHGLENEIEQCINNGATPYEALLKRDL